MHVEMNLFMHIGIIEFISAGLKGTKINTVAIWVKL